MKENLSITIIQSDLVWENIDANLINFTRKIESLQKEKTIVVLPEMFSTGFSMQPKLFAEKKDGKTITWMKEIAVKHKIVLTGSIIIEEENKFYNRLIWMMPNGEYYSYDKRHLFAYAGENEHYTAGNKRLIVSVNGWKINLQICYDLRFPVWARQHQKDNNPEYDILLYVANWPERRTHAWQTLLTARAIENQSYVVAVNRVGEDGNEIYHSGNSCVLNPTGETLFAVRNEECIYNHTFKASELEEIRNDFPFLQDGDDFIIN